MKFSELCLRLRAAGIESAEWEAQLLLEHFCGADSLSMLDTERDWTVSDAFEAAIVKRCERYPLQYLIGVWDFYRQTYEVSPDCLIPRSDTEHLVERAIRLLPPSARFADLCTGSGCIAISTLAERRDTTAIAVDKFENTLAMASKNATRNGVSERLELILSDVLAPDCLPVEEGSLDAILSNPPYIRADVIPTLEAELSAEPRAALDGGESGLVFYEAILRECQKYLNPQGFFLFEIGYDQADALRELGERYGFSGFAVIRDFGGNDRVVHLWRAPA